MFVALFLIIIGGYPGYSAPTNCPGVRSRSDESKFVQKIATLAIPHHLTVLYLEVIEISDQEPAAYLRLSNLCSLTGVYSIVSETRLVIGGNWIREVRSLAGRRPNRLPC